MSADVPVDMLYERNTVLAVINEDRRPDRATIQPGEDKGFLH